MAVSAWQGLWYVPQLIAPSSHYHDTLTCPLLAAGLRPRAFLATIPLHPRAMI
jgi:hypothetical protein